MNARLGSGSLIAKRKTSIQAWAALRLDCVIKRGIGRLLWAGPLAGDDDDRPGDDQPTTRRT
jgi:hypothetical protein